MMEPTLDMSVLQTTVMLRPPLVQFTTIMSLIITQQQWTPFMSIHPWGRLPRMTVPSASCSKIVIRCDPFT